MEWLGHWTIQAILVRDAFKVAEHSFARALANTIQRAHKGCKNKHGVGTVAILFAQFPR